MDSLNLPIPFRTDTEAVPVSTPKQDIFIAPEPTEQTSAEAMDAAGKASAAQEPMPLPFVAAIYGWPETAAGYNALRYAETIASSVSSLS